MKSKVYKLCLFVISNYVAEEYLNEWIGLFLVDLLAKPKKTRTRENSHSMSM